MDAVVSLTSAELWHEAAFEAYPAVVAHEYRRLRDLLAEGQVYGALLQTKDLFEVILKLPVLAYAAHLYRKDRDQTENKLLVDLLKEPLSLGTWESLGRRMLNQAELPASAAAMEKHLSQVLDLFSKCGIVKWRNDVIGHGALSLNEAHDLERDIAELLRAAKAFFLGQDEFYRGVELRLEDGSAEPEVLRGAGKARLGGGGQWAGAGLNAASDAAEKVPVSLRSGDFAVNLFPFAYISEGDIFFFDSFLYRKEKSCVISYPPGFRKNEALAEVQELAKTVDLATTIASVEGGFGDDTYLAENDQVIQSLFAVDDFRRPDHLVDWLSLALKAYPKGVFHLAMEMGMGKSTFARALDPTRCGSDMAIPLKNATVRGYFLNDSYLSTAEAFCNAVNDIFNRDKEGQQLFQSSAASLPSLKPGSERPAQDLAELLRFYRDAYERHYGTSRLLFVVDGLEEIPAGQVRGLMDFIPEPEALAEGVFILLTSRTAGELPAHFGGSRALQTATEHLVVDRHHPGYRRVLGEYIQKNILESSGLAGVVDPAVLTEKAEGRFLYVRLYRDLLRSYGHDRPEALPEGPALLERYLERLRLLYGDKFYARATTLMAILASAYEPLTLRELAYLSGREEIDFLMLAHLADLRAFFKTDRSYRGNLVSLHAEWKSAAKRLLGPAIRELVVGWIGESVSMPEEALDAGNEGMTYLLARLEEYGEEYGEGEPLRSRAVARTFATLAYGISGKSRAVHDVERQLLIFGSALSLYGELEEKGEDVLDSLARIYINRGDVFRIQLEPAKALADYRRAAEIWEKLDAAGRLQDRNDLASLYANRGLAFRAHLDPVRAIADYERAIEIREKLDAEGRLKDGNYLAAAYMSRGIVFWSQQEHAKAIFDHDRAIEIREKLDAEGLLKDRNDLAAAYMSRGVVFWSQQEHAKAIIDHDRAIEIREKLDAEGRLKDRNDLATAYTNRGIVFWSQEAHTKAIADYERAIEIREKLDAEGRLLNRNDLASVYMNRGVAFSDKQEPARAIADYERAIEIREKLDAEERLLDRNDLASVYMNRGMAFSDRQELAKAIADYERAIKIQEKLEAEGRLLDRNALASVYMSRGIAYRDQHEPVKAIADYERALDIREKLDAEGRLLDRNDLAGVYWNRGILFSEQPELGNAIADYTRAIEIQERLNKEGRPLDWNHLAEVYLQRGYMRKQAGKFWGAFCDFFRSGKCTVKATQINRRRSGDA